MVASLPANADRRSSWCAAPLPVVEAAKAQTNVTPQEAALRELVVDVLRELALVRYAHWPSLPLACCGRAPIFEGEPLESRKVLHVGGHQNEIVNARYRGDLAVNVWSWTTKSFLPRSLESMPGCSLLVVGKYRERLEDDVAQVGFELSFALARLEPFAPVGQLVPHH